MGNLWIGLLVTGVLIYQGIIYDNASIVGVGFVLGCVLILSIIELLYRFFTIRAQVDVPISLAEPDQLVSVELKIRNKSLLPTGRIDVYMGISNAFSKKKKMRWITIPEAKAGEKSATCKVVLAGAGNHEIEIKKLRIYGLFGLLHIKKRCKDFSSVLIMPEIHTVATTISDATKNFIGDADVYDEFRPGHDSGETFAIRNYREKDRLQSVHWKLSARMDELMVKESSLPKACAIVLLLDFCQIKKQGKHYEDFLELASSLSFCLMDEKCPHFVAWYSKETGDIRRIRVDDEESFYMFLMYYLKDGQVTKGKDIREEYRQKYKHEWYLHDIRIDANLRIYRDGESYLMLDKKKLSNEWEKLEFIL